MLKAVQERREDAGRHGVPRGGGGGCGGAALFSSATSVGSVVASTPWSATGSATGCTVIRGSLMKPMRAVATPGCSIRLSLRPWTSPAPASSRRPSTRQSASRRAAASPSFPSLGSTSSFHAEPNCVRWSGCRQGRRNFDRLTVRPQATTARQSVNKCAADVAGRSHALSLALSQHSARTRRSFAHIVIVDAPADGAIPQPALACMYSPMWVGIESALVYV